MGCQNLSLENAARSREVFFVMLVDSNETWVMKTSEHRSKVQNILDNAGGPDLGPL